MIKKIAYIESKETLPYFNLALEEYLLHNVEQEQCILYLWQNQRTVVVGHNQNIWKECLVSELSKDGGHLVRRLSGGGAVFHDLGNLNFTFLVRKEDYNLEKQLNVILNAVKKLGIHAEKSGRNDILAQGKKFSGNAYFETEGRCYHHGTIMVNVKMSDLTKYLTVSKEKLNSKGVDSVQSRVVNLVDLQPEVTISKLKVKLLEAFQEEYEIALDQIEVSDLDQEKIQELADKFSSWDTIYGKKIKFQHQIEKRFSWGNFQLQLEVNGGIIKDAMVYSDALVPWFIQQIAPRLIGVRYDIFAMQHGLKQVIVSTRQEKEMLVDILEMILEM